MADILDEYANARPLTDSEWDAVRLIPLLGKDRGEGRWINQLVATVADLRERLASLQAERYDLRVKLADVATELAFRPTNEAYAALLAKLALRDAVVEAARFCLEHGQIMNNGDRVADAIAALDASENPRGATPKEND